MKAYIEYVLWDAEKTPIVLHLTEQDKRNIANMPEGYNFYMVHDENVDWADDFMEDAKLAVFAQDK